MRTLFVLYILLSPCVKYLLSGKILGRGFLNEDACSSKSFCGSDCKALRGGLQSFALALAKLCVGSCNALRLRWAKQVL